MFRKKLLRHIFRFHGFKESFIFAFKGILYLFLYHRNMRIIFLMGIAAFLLGIFLGLSGLELSVLCLTITIVFMAEIFNTAIEMVIDMYTRKHKVLIKFIKDIAAAVVLLASLNAIAVGYALFYKRVLALTGGR